MNKTKQNKTKQNKTKQNKTKHSLLCRYGLTSAAALLLAFGGASAVRADQRTIEMTQEQLQAIREAFPKLEDSVPGYDVLSQHGFYKHLREFEHQLGFYLKTLDQNLSQLQGERGETGPAGPAGPT
ncbi:TPA: hypothetical protein ACQMXN_001846, partial [Streptococcus pyogenes]